MAKVKITNYVKTLDQLLVESDKKTINKHFVGYLKLLKKHKQLKQINEILDLYQEGFDRQNQLLRAHVYYGEQQLDTLSQNKIIDFLKKKFKVKKVILIMIKKQIGQGYVIEADNHFFDFTFETQLKKFKHQLLET